MERVSIPMKKKKPRTIHSFVGIGEDQGENNSNKLKASTILEDETEKPLAV